MGVFDTARSLINRLEAAKEDLVFSRDRDFVDSLREADADLAAGDTISLADLTAETEAEDRPLAL